jgi:hypothetical protein
MTFSPPEKRGTVKCRAMHRADSETCLNHDKVFGDNDQLGAIGFLSKSSSPWLAISADVIVLDDSILRMAM